MPQTPALDVAVRPSRLAVAARYGTACGISWVRARLISSVGTAPPGTVPESTVGRSPRRACARRG